MANGEETKDNLKLKTTNELAHNDKSVVKNYTLGGTKSSIASSPNKGTVLTHYNDDGSVANRTCNKKEINAYKSKVEANEITDMKRDIAKSNPRDKSKDKDVKPTMTYTTK